MLIGNDFSRKCYHKDLGLFVSLYDETPESFMNKYKEEVSIDLENKLVISLECSEGVSIIGGYSVLNGQKAKLSYCGHISFIDIRHKDTNEKIDLLWKDDECIPQTFDEWWSCSNECHMLEEEYGTTQEKVLNLINTIVRAAEQNLDITYNKEDIIILEGL